MTSHQIQYGGWPPYWKSFFGYIWTIYCPINAKFGMKKQNHVPTQVTWPEYQISKIQDGGQPPFWKSFIAKSQPGISLFQWNLVRLLKLCFQGRSHNKFPKFCKFKTADGHHIENRFSAIPQRFIVWLTRNFVRRSRIRHMSRDQNFTGSRYLNRGNKTANINVKKL